MLCSVNCPEALSEAYVTCGKCRRQFSTHVGSSGRSRFPETLTTFRFSCRACSQLANHARRRPVPHTGSSNEVVPIRWFSSSGCLQGTRVKQRVGEMAEQKRYRRTLSYTALTSTCQPTGAQRSAVAQCAAPLNCQLPENSLGVICCCGGGVIVRLFDARLLVKQESYLDNIAGC